ncbi:MAG: integrase family protein [Acidimicrobiaceae bacterium]|nr:integrase family protein [Acidimicrobiaceae bacterium]
MTDDLEALRRFESHVDRSGEHHVWLGSRNPQRGTGKVEVNGKQMTAHRRAWELANGPIPAHAVILPCADELMCVRLDHLRLFQGSSGRSAQSRRRAGTSARVQIQVNGVRVHRRVRGDRKDVESTRALLREQLQQAGPQDRDTTRWTVEDLIHHYLEHAEEQGKALRTRRRYADVAKNWVAPVIGCKLARRVTPEEIDRCFARMRKAGQSAGSMNYAKALLSGAFKWARRTGKVLHDPMLGFQLPRSTYVPRERLPPEAADISLILHSALEHTPDIAPILTLAATTCARLGELVAPRRSDIHWERQTMWVNAAADVDGTLKDPKRAQHRREVPLDDGTLAVLRRQLEQMEERAAIFEVPLAADPFIFSLEPDCSKPINPDRVTKRLQVLKGHLGVEDKRPETIVLEDQALLLRRSGAVDRTGRPGPPPREGAAMSYGDIAKSLGRTEMWAKRACAAAIRREYAAGRESLNFNLSFNGFR